VRIPSSLVCSAVLAGICQFTLGATEAESATDARMLRQIFDTALTSSPAYDQLRELTQKFPGRLSGSKNLEASIHWSRDLLLKTGAEHVELQPVMVPHWERGAPERVHLGDRPLAALALGGTVATPEGGLTAEVVELQSLDALVTTDVQGKIVFFNRPMDPTHIATGTAYSGAGDQRGRGPAEAAKHGAVGALVRSLTLSLDDIPHTGNTSSPPGVKRIPAAALSTLAANALSEALKANPHATVSMQLNSRWHDDSLSHNVIAEVKGSEFPEKIILVGGHIDSWDITEGAHDDATGCIQSIEVLRIFKALNYAPRHTLRIVLFTNEENGMRGAIAYSTRAKERNEVHVLALETDSGGFQPRGFNLGNPTGNAHLRAARWAPLFTPYGITVFQKGTGGVDVSPLLAHGATVAGLMPDSQRYFDYHHTAIDTFDKVNKREFELGAAAMASLVYLVDQHGL
jgi:carboxypeptidase Q